MKRFPMIVKSVLTILAVVPFSLIGVLVVATVSKPEPEDTVSAGEPHHEGKHAAPSPSRATDGRPVVIERLDSKVSRTITTRMFGCWQTLRDTNGKNGGSLGRNSLEEETVMTKPVSDMVFTPSVKTVQACPGSRQHYAHMEECGGWSDTITPERGVFYVNVTHAILPRPYIQHRGDPKGLLNVLDDHTPAFADFKGNRQYLSVGNLAGINQAFLYFMDYATQTRIKIWERADVIEEDPDLPAQLTVPGYKGKPEWVIRFRVEAWGANYRQHIPLKYLQDEVDAIVQPLRDRLAALEVEHAALKRQWPVSE